MSERKWTSGPWKAAGYGYQEWKQPKHGAFAGAIRSENGQHIYAGPSSLWALCGATQEEATANAHLISAAPDLYEALDALVEACLRQNLKFGALVGPARVALAKARGEQ